jgi:hypothetical protein
VGVVALALALLAAPRAATAWPADIVEALARDARRIVPKSLAALMADRETEIFAATRAVPPELSQALAADLAAGELRPATMALLDARASAAAQLFRDRRVTDGVVELGALLRIPADLSDPVLVAGPGVFPPGVTREYYAFLGASLDKIPVVLDDPPALKLRRRDLPGYWRGLLGKTRVHSPVIRTGLFQNGRLVDHRTLDFRSPVFGVASLAYSRAVTAIAATWLAVWRDVRGDVTRMRSPTAVRPSDAPPLAPEARLPVPGAAPERRERH